jgi:hypothetical protein
MTGYFEDVHLSVMLEADDSRVAEIEKTAAAVDSERLKI